MRTKREPGAEIGRVGIYILTAILSVFVGASMLHAAPFNWDNPKPLPPPSGTIVNVSTVNQLVNAVQNLQNGQTIVIAPGTYSLGGVTDALYIRQGISGWAIRGASGNRDDVIIQGNGMNGSVSFGFWIGNSSNGTIADLTIRNIKDHGIIANPGAHTILYHNLRVVDSGDQFLKANPQSPGNGNNGGIVEYCVFEYTTHENGAGTTPDYTNGVDVHGGNDWIIRFNLFKNIIHRPGGGLAGPAILMWNTCRNTVAEGNTFINVARGIAFGLVDQSNRNDHEGGVMFNNFFYRAAGLSGAFDVPFATADSPGTKIFHNTVLDLGNYPNAIEYRYPASSNTQIRNNLLDGAIVARDGASASQSGNVTNAAASLFVNPNLGDLHLKSSASVAIDQVTVLPEASIDIDAQNRPVGSAADIGADEYSVGTDTLLPSAPSNLRQTP